MRPKYEREIDEILSRLDDDRPGGAVITPIRPAPAPRQVRTPRMPLFYWRPNVELTPSNLMIGALALAVLGYPVQSVLPVLVGPIGVVAALMLIGAVVLSLTKWHRRRPEKIWRGRVMEEQESVFGASSLSRRWRRWKAHRRFRDPRWN